MLKQHFWKILLFTIFIVFVLYFYFTFWQEDKYSLDEADIQKNITEEEIIDHNINDAIDENIKSNKHKVNKLCDWIDKSDIILELKLPEEYAQYNNAHSFPSYEVGFVFKDKYGMDFNSLRLARKQCNYRVGFNKSELINQKMPLRIVAYKSKSEEFNYIDDSSLLIKNIEALDNLDKIVIKVN